MLAGSVVSSFVPARPPILTWKKFPDGRP
jgi:hypothetical protein